MWLYRGAQSAVFYYATCTPCANSIDRRKRMKDAARSQREKARLDAIVTDQPRPFAQPTPFSTNQGWAEEIALGPGPPARRHRAAHRRTESWNTDARSSTSCQDPGRKGGKKKLDKSSLMQPLEERWNRMRFQREDEPLWGEEVEVKGSSVGISGRGQTHVQEPSKYYIARVPPVNDLHPPIVSGPKSRAETRWMLQPPPSAKVMVGKERFNTRNSGYGNLPSDRSRVATKSAAERTHQLPPLSTETTDPHAPKSSSLTPITPLELRSPKTPGPDTSLPLRHLPPPITPAAYSRDESQLVIMTPLHSPTDPSPLSSPSDSDWESTRVSLQSPGTPVSRPGSNGVDNGAKQYRPTISKTLSTVQRDPKKVQMVHLEINDSNEDVGLGEFERLRPWRWSMDI